MPNVMVIGIAGGSGSGKTTITRQIMNRFGDDVSILLHDNYYKAHNELTYEERTKLNFDHPDAFDTEMMVRHLRALKRGESIRCPVYDFTIHNRTEQMITIQPAKVVLVEGILIFHSEEMAELMDIKVYIDTDSDVRVLRRLVRDVRERGRSLESVVSQYLNTVKPMHEEYVEPSKKRADIIIPEGGFNRVAVELLYERIRSHVEQLEQVPPNVDDIMFHLT